MSKSEFQVMKRRIVIGNKSRTLRLVETRLMIYYMRWLLLKLKTCLRLEQVAPFQEWLLGRVIGELTPSFPVDSYDAFIDRAIHGFAVSELVYRVGAYCVVTKVKRGVLVVTDAWPVKEGELA